MNKLYKRQMIIFSNMIEEFTIRIKLQYFAKFGDIIKVIKSWKYAGLFHKTMEINVTYSRESFRNHTSVLI